MIEFEVPEALDGERVDRALALLTDWTRADVGRIVASGAVLVEGLPVRKSRRLSMGERVEVTSEPEPDALPVPEAISLDLRYEDADLIVLAKPVGLVVHPSAGHPSGTLVNALLAHAPEIATVGDPYRPGIVHRLDRDTSGLMVVARSNDALAQLVAMLTRHEVERRYLALVWGGIEPANGTIDAPIGRSVRRRTRMAVREGGKEAVTNYEVRERFTTTTLLDCGLETGRTHQIRVHLSAIGHPVVGDAPYGGRREPIALARPFLHAWRLAFAHPLSGEALAFEDPVPLELDRLLADLREA